MPDLVSLKSMRYRHWALRPGVPFSVPTDIEASLLKRAGHAVDAVADEPAEPEMEMVAAEPAERPARPALKRKPPRYQRRGMSANV